MKDFSVFLAILERRQLKILQLIIGSTVDRNKMLSSPL
jgi:hypothetical protein